MQFLKKLFGGSQIVSGLDLGAFSLKLAYVEKTQTGYKLARYLETSTPPMTIKDGSIIDARVLGDTIKSAIAANKFNVDSVVGAVCGQTVVIRPITMTQMNERELQNAVKFEAERYLPYSVADAMVKGTIIRKEIEGDEKNMEVLLVAAPNETVANIQEVVKMAGSSTSAMDLEPFALVRAAQMCLDENVAKQTIAIIDVGSASSSINIFKEGILRHNRTITTAGSSFTKAIGQSLNLSYEEAEKIKKEKGVVRVEKDATPVAPTTMRIFNVIIPVLQELITEVQRSFDYYRSRYQGETVDHVLLSGGTARFKNIDQYVSNELGVPCEIANPLKNIDISNVSGYSEDVLKEMAPGMMVVIGLALRPYM